TNVHHHIHSHHQRTSSASTHIITSASASASAGIGSTPPHQHCPNRSPLSPARPAPALGRRRNCPQGPSRAQGTSARRRRSSALPFLPAFHSPRSLRHPRLARRSFPQSVPHSCAPPAAAMKIALVSLLVGISLLAVPALANSPSPRPRDYTTTPIQTTSSPSKPSVAPKIAHSRSFMTATPTSATPGGHPVPHPSSPRYSTTATKTRIYPTPEPKDL
ncbi:uncharacterized protein BJ171DRAFT_171905, partial [Polychytrium aggregatum]|uniref:uncharacterized protein n=1 Tax=Polychytrium aggregatum TaxID=110093 RepID=UPI0022FEF264